MINLGDHQEICTEIGPHPGPGGEITAREILVSRRGKRYTITVALSSYLREPPEDGEKVLILDDISSVEAICQELASRPTEDLRPFLTPQLTP